MCARSKYAHQMPQKLHIPKLINIYLWRRMLPLMIEPELLYTDSDNDDATDNYDNTIA